MTQNVWSLVSALFLTLCVSTSVHGQQYLARPQNLPVDYDEFAHSPAEQMRPDLTAITDQISLLFGDRLAGLSVEHKPELKLIVLLTGAQVPASQIHVVSGQNVLVEFRGGATSSKKQLLAAQSQTEKILSLLPTFHGSSLDEVNGQLVLYVDQQDRPSPEKAGEVSVALGVPVSIVVSERARLDIEIVTEPDIL